MEVSKPSCEVQERSDHCEIHGDYTSRLLTFGGMIRGRWTSCPDCNKAREEAEAEERRIAEQRAKQERIERRLQSAGIPPRFRHKVFPTFQADTSAKQHSLDLSMQFANSFDEKLKNGASMVFSGTPGTGKSHLACAIAQHVMEAGYTAIYLTAMDLIRLVRSTWRRDSERSEEDVIRELSRVDLLVLDEVGMQYGSEGEQVIMTDIIDQRYRNSLPLIVITNQDRKGLTEYLGHRAFDRLRDGGTWESFDWESYRARKSA